MQVCLDIQAAIGQRAGVGRYTRALAEHLIAQTGSDSLRLFYFDFRRRGLSFDPTPATARACRLLPGRWVQQSWKRLYWPPYDWLAGRADVFHFPNFIIPPLRRGRTVTTIHDVSFLRFPSMAESKNLAYLKKHITATVQRADAIITDSQFSAGEIAGLLKADPSRIHAIPLGAADHFQPPTAADVERVRQRHGLTRPYLLTVGTLEPRKNMTFLADVFECLPDFDGELIIAGMRGWHYEPILQRLRSSPQATAIRCLDYVADCDLPALYGAAELFLFPSLYEGFGLPPLEAMLCGVPVLASSAGALPEVLGNGACLMTNFDADAWARECRRLLGDSAARLELITAGKAQAGKYTWRETARRTWSVYRSLAV